MTEETKLILDKLEIVGSDVRELKTRVGSLETKVDSLDSKVGVLETDMKRMQLTLENEVDRNIKLIAEGHLDLNRKLTEALKYKEEHELLQVRMNLAEADIKRLKDAVFVSA